VVADELNKRLLEDVVIFSGKSERQTGAQSLAPDHLARESYSPSPLPAKPVPSANPSVPTQGVPDLQRQVEQFLYYQSELLDTKNWAAYIELFCDDGVYWMPARPEQTEWLDSPSIMAEDRQLMTVRMGRITHPNAWSQAPFWGTSHVVGNVAIEQLTANQLMVRSRFHVLELRRDAVRHFAGVYRHTLRRVADDFKIGLQRVDLLNASAPFDYTIQAWV
jgi:3-phenylpropionate/cinnamic acid dioxygenase small subunit